MYESYMVVIIYISCSEANFNFISSNSGGTVQLDSLELML